MSSLSTRMPHVNETIFRADDGTAIIVVLDHVDGTHTCQDATDRARRLVTSNHDLTPAAWVVRMVDGSFRLLDRDVFADEIAFDGVCRISKESIESMLGIDLDGYLGDHPNAPVDPPATTLADTIRDQAGYYGTWDTDTGNLIARELGRLADRVESYTTKGETMTVSQFESRDREWIGA